jgi:hypothetical protein
MVSSTEQRQAQFEADVVQLYVPARRVGMLTRCPSASSTGCLNGTIPLAKTLTLDNTKSTVAVSWQARAVETILNAPWAGITDAAGNPFTSGTVGAGAAQSIIVSPYPPMPIEVCHYSLPPPTGTTWHVRIVAAGTTYTFGYTVS